MKFSELYSTAEAPDPSKGGGHERWEPPAGLNLPATVVKVNTGETAKGLPKFGIWFEVTDGEHKTKRFWANLFFSTSDVANGISFAAMAAMGLTKAFFEADPEPAAVGAALVGKKANVRTGYRTDDKTGKVWGNHSIRTAEETFDEEDDTPAPAAEEAPAEEVPDVEVSELPF